MNYFSQGNLFVITSSSSMHRNSLVRVPKKKKKREDTSRWLWSRPWKYWKDFTTTHQEAKKIKKNNVISEQETSDTSKHSETDNNFMLNVIQEEGFNYLVRVVNENISLRLRIWFVI